MCKGFGVSPEADRLSIKMPPPRGVLRITAHKATSLRAKDSAGLFSGASSDPYVVLSIGPESYKSQTINRNLNPVFDFACEFPIFAASLQKLHVELMDSDYNA